MERIKIRTKIDITNTEVRHPDQGPEKSLNQHRNYTTFLQVLGLRSVFNIMQVEQPEEGVWSLIIETDRDGVFSDGDDPVGLLKKDLDKVPIITGLDEKAALKHGLIRTSGSTPNTFVSLLR